MTNYYNSGLQYNSRYNYNSATYYVVEVSDAGQAQELLFFIPSNIIKIFETAHIQEFVSNIVNMSVSDSASGVDSISDLIQFPSDAYFVITCEGYMNPLGVIVLRDSRHDILPSIKEFSDEIPGRHGKVYFGSKFGSRLLELHVATPEGLTPELKELQKRNIAKYLNPVAGSKSLIFANEPEKMYVVKYAGKIDLTQYADWMEFTIPFKMANPYIIGSTEKFFSGSGIITNSGNAETPLIIEINGEITNPVITIGSYVLSYSGTIPAGQTLVVDTEKKTVTLNGENVLYNWSGGFPKLQPGDNLVSADSKVTFKWRDRWL